MRRTKKQKQQAAKRRKIVTPSSSGGFAYTASPSKKDAMNRVSTKKQTGNDDDLLFVPAHYIKSDLIKTSILSVVFIGVIFGLYWFFELGGRGVVGW